MDQAALWVALAGAFAGAALALMRKRKKVDPKSQDALSVLGLTPAEAKARVASPPLDLARPIATDEDWEALRRHARDEAYRAALDQLRTRYRFADPMLLPNTLRTAMQERGLGFREAVIAAAKDDALG